MNTSYMITARKCLKEELPICLGRSVGVCLMGNPFFASHTILHMGLSLLLGVYFSLAHGKIERVVLTFKPADGPVDGERKPSAEITEDKALAEKLAEGSIPFKLVFKFLLTIPFLLLGFKILSPIWTLCISMQHNLSLQCGVIQLLVSTFFALVGLLIGKFDQKLAIAVEGQLDELEQQVASKEVEIGELKQQVAKGEAALHKANSQIDELNFQQQQALQDRAAGEPEQLYVAQDEGVCAETGSQL